MPKEKRNSYSVTFKLDVIKYTKTTNNIKAARQYNINHMMVLRIAVLPTTVKFKMQSLLATDFIQHYSNAFETFKPFIT
ncbi:5220_t:CDS:2, partial [Racocetra fulgida]